MECERKKWAGNWALDLAHHLRMKKEEEVDSRRQAKRRHCL